MPKENNLWWNSNSFQNNMIWIFSRLLCFVYVYVRAYLGYRTFKSYLANYTMPN